MLNFAHVKLSAENWIIVTVLRIVLWLKGKHELACRECGAPVALILARHFVDQGCPVCGSKRLIAI